MKVAHKNDVNFINWIWILSLVCIYAKPTNTFSTKLCLAVGKYISPGLSNLFALTVSCTPGSSPSCHRWAAGDSGLSGREPSLCFVSSLASQDVPSSRQAENNGRGSPAWRTHMPSTDWIDYNFTICFLHKECSCDTIFNRHLLAIFITTAGNVLKRTQVSLKANPNRKSESKA